MNLFKPFNKNNTIYLKLFLLKDNIYIVIVELRKENLKKNCNQELRLD